ncbi:MAG: hypothetical protein GY754_10360 [bacterium]|nr:hypothetical protein [bacterium]
MGKSSRLSDKSSNILKRLAWAMDVPVAEAAEAVFEFLPGIVEGKRVCARCRDHSRCDECGFDMFAENGGDGAFVELVRER